jgi:ComF family protein
VSKDSSISLKTLLTSVLDLVYPPVCQVCGRGFTGDNIWLCDSCRQVLSAIPAPACPVCRTLQPEPLSFCCTCGRSTSIAWVYSLGTYDQYYSKLIQAFKYKPRPGLGSLLGAMVSEKLRTFPHLRQIEMVCAVPIHPSKRRRRGFNQSEILAEAIAGSLGLPHRRRALVQPSETADQIGLSVVERVANVHDAYLVPDGCEVSGLSVLLVDDVTTSGATLNSAATALKRAGAARIAATTVAMALEPGVEPEAMYIHYWENF